jgi:hypothetical protein
MIPLTDIDLVVARLEAWLESTRGPFGQLGYSGPVAHWWQQSLLYTGPGYDWRYEGIILGYLALWQRSGEERWLVKARRAGDDLVHAQTGNGHYPVSAFELNPAAGGTPHEAAACLGLLALASALRGLHDPGWELYLSAAEKTLRSFYLEKLWDSQARSFRDHPQIASFVPNKAATASQALLDWCHLTGDARWADLYALPNLENVLAHQVTQPGFLQGAIAQNSFGRQVIPKYMPYYIARCVPGLLAGYAWSGQERFVEAARLAMDFVLRQRSATGGLLQVRYPGRQFNTRPVWVAALGDVFLAADDLARYGITYDLEDLQQFMLGGADASGGLQTARGFAVQAGGNVGSTPDFRDLLHVAGWCDKPFHWLARHTSGSPLPPAICQPFHAACTFQGLALTFFEDQERLQAVQAGKVIYLWIKGEKWARHADPAFWLH